MPEWLIILGIIGGLYLMMRKRPERKDAAAVTRSTALTATERRPSVSRSVPETERRQGGGATREMERLETFVLNPVVDRPAQTPTASSAAPSSTWVAPNVSVTVANTTIPGGMVYVGSELPVPGRYGADNCLIDPRLPVALRYQPGEETGFHYWPQYSQITPAGRRAFLDWLGGGRSDPAADIGWVFLFFYGLERRLFLERQAAEAPVLVAEVERLLTIYGSNRSFQAYATAFRAAAAMLSGKTNVRVEPHLPEGYVTELPFASRVHLGALLAEKRALAAEDALLWAVGLPEARLRTPATRCFPELRQLFTVRFAERYPKGLQLRAPKRKLSLTYRAASGTFTSQVFGPGEDLPDITALTAPIPGLLALVDACQTELEPFSRYLGRTPNARGTLQAAQLLPSPLQAEASAMAIAPTRNRVSELIGNAAIGAVPVRHLLAALEMPLAEKAAKVPLGLMSSMAQRLDLLGFGIEPDRRYGGQTVAADEEVALFRAEAGAPIDPNCPPFLAAKAALEIGMLAAMVDGALRTDEIAGVVEHAKQMPGLDPTEQLRLEAFVLTLRGQAKSAAALKRAASMPQTARQAVAAAAVTAVLADGTVAASEIAFLERVYRALGLPVEGVHSALHQGAAVERQALPASAPRPAMPSASGDGVVGLDASRLERVRAETSAVSSLLSDIFAEDHEATAAPTTAGSGPAGGQPEPFEGLDIAHGRLLQRVLSARQMAVADFQAAAREAKLLPDGAIETINDWAFDRFGEAILDTVDDEVTVADHLAEDLQALEKVA